MRHNILTYIVIFLVFVFIIYIYTAKLPLEEYINQYGDILEGFDDEEDMEEPFENNNESSDDENSDSEKNDNKDIKEGFQENLTYADGILYSPFCYNLPENQCKTSPSCYWDYGSGSCKQNTVWYNPFYGGWYNWYNRFWSPWRWNYPYYSYYSYPTYSYRYPRWYPRRGGGKYWRSRGHKGFRRSGIRRGGRRGGRRSGGRRR